MTVKLAAKLPTALNANGLTPIERDLIDEPGSIHFIVAAIRTQKITITPDGDDSEEVPTVQLIHVEVVRGVRERDARDMLTTAMTERTGLHQLPFESGNDD